MVTILSFRDREHPLFHNAINTTSRSNSWSRGLSPFLLGPVELYGGLSSLNMENAWQYAKVYDRPDFYDPERDLVLPGYRAWAEAGWNSARAERYPMGKGAIPLFSLWDGQRMGYLEARRRIYVPLYAAAVRRSAAFEQLQDEYRKTGSIALLDFDAYDFRRLKMSWRQVLEHPGKKMGHAFVLGMLLEGVLEEVLAAPKPPAQGVLFE